MRVSATGVATRKSHQQTGGTQEALWKEMPEGAGPLIKPHRRLPALGLGLVVKIRLLSSSCSRFGLKAIKSFQKVKLGTKVHVLPNDISFVLLFLGRIFFYIFMARTDSRQHSLPPFLIQSIDGTHSMNPQHTDLEPSWRGRVNRGYFWKLHTMNNHK